jgi:hypothetical protein
VTKFKIGDRVAFYESGYEDKGKRFWILFFMGMTATGNGCKQSLKKRLGQILGNSSNLAKARPLRLKIGGRNESN